MFDDETLMRGYRAAEDRLIRRFLVRAPVGRPLLVGQAPGPPLGGRGGRLLSGLVGGPLSDRFDVANLLWEFPGKAGKGDANLAESARAAAADLLAADGHDRLVLAGRAVQAAFGLPPGVPLRVAELADRAVLALPHPSGINRWWNDPANRSAASAALLAFAG